VAYLILNKFNKNLVSVLSHKNSFATRLMEGIKNAQDND
jgi:hypothetical protein